MESILARYSGLKPRLVLALMKEFMVALGSCYPSILLTDFGTITPLIYRCLYTAGAQQFGLPTPTFRILYSLPGKRLPWIFVGFCNISGDGQLQFKNMSDFLLIDKENNANHANICFRKMKKTKEQERPGTSVLLGTFNPLPRINQISIPVLQPTGKDVPSRQDILSELQGKMPRSKQGPVIAKSNKLRQFFAPDSDRYSQKRKMSLNPREMIRNSVDSIKSQRKCKDIIPVSKTLEIPQRGSRKQQFSKIYQRQKTQYQKIFKKYGIQESVDDRQYHRFMNQ